MVKKKGTPNSPKLQHYWCLTIWLFSVISRAPVGEVWPTELFVVWVRRHFSHYFMMSMPVWPISSKLHFYFHIFYFLIVDNFHLILFLQGNWRVWAEQLTAPFELYSSTSQTCYLFSSTSSNLSSSPSSLFNLSSFLYWLPFRFLFTWFLPLRRFVFKPEKSNFVFLVYITRVFFSIFPVSSDHMTSWYNHNRRFKRPLGSLYINQINDLCFTTLFTVWAFLNSILCDNNRFFSIYNITTVAAVLNSSLI